MFPQFPNVVTLRGEKIRKPIEYIKTLNLLIALAPEVLIPSHGPVVRGTEKIHQGLVRIRDAVQYVHDATVAGMNEGKTLHQLMAEITLPPELALTQSHGKISWAVKSLWEYYASWFHFESTTDLYPVSVRQLYPELAALAGVGPLIKRATQKLQNNEPLQALHLVEIALAADPANTTALSVRLSALKDLLAQAENGDRVDYEMYYLKRRIEITEEALQAATN
jgi:alkyl sulfatase BDS1-like metallo-beta-lactamase superfamily hydrolase